MTPSIARLRQALEAGPTPGAWTLVKHNRDADERMDAGDDWTIRATNGPSWENVCFEGTAHAAEANAQFIAAANPEVIREVLDLLDAAEKDAGRLDWLLSNPNTVLEDAGNEWFILDEDGEPTYFKTGRAAIDAAISARASTAGDAL